jgi:hypothetical protein
MLAHPLPQLLRREADHPELVVRISERREDPAADAKVGVAVVGVFDGLFEAEGDPAKSC